MKMSSNQDDAKPVPTAIGNRRRKTERGDKTQKTRDRRQVVGDRRQGWLSGDG